MSQRGPDGGAAESSLRRPTSSRGGSVRDGGTLTDTQAALLARDRALQLRLLPALRHVHAEPRARTGLDALLPRPWPTSARRHERWLFLLSILAILSGFITPFRIAFLRPGVSSHVAGWELFCDIIFTLNMVVYATCVLPPGVADASRAQIAAQYARTSLLSRDLIAALPYDFIAYACGLRNRDALFVLGFVRLRRLRRTFETMATYEADLRLPYSTLRALRFTLYALLQVHGFACAFGFLAQREGGVANWLNVGEALKASTHAHDAWPHYLLSLYWAVTTFCGVGYGDMTPQNPREYVFVIVFMLTNYGLAAYVIGNMSVLATMQESTTRQFREQAADMEAFFEAHLLPEPLRASLRAAMQLRQSDARDHREVMEAFPPVLRRKCKRLLYSPLIRGAYIFFKTPVTFRQVLCTMMTVDLFLPGTAVLTQGLPVFDLYVITSGTAEFVLTHEDSAAAAAAAAGDEQESWGADGVTGDAFDEVGAGDVFGEAPFCFRLVNPFAVRARTLMRTLSLNRDGWKAVLASRPDYAALVEDAVAEHVYGMAEEEAGVEGSPWPGLAKAVRAAREGAADAKPQQQMPHVPSEQMLHQPRVSITASMHAKLAPMKGD